MQSQGMEFIFPKWAPSVEKNQLIIPEWTEKILRKQLVEGECEFWDILCPGFAPNPFLCSFGFGVSLLGLSSWLVLVGSSSSMEALLLLAALHAPKACITSEGEVAKTATPP